MTLFDLPYTPEVPGIHLPWTCAATGESQWPYRRIRFCDEARHGRRAPADVDQGFREPNPASSGQESVVATRDADAPGHLHLALIAERGQPACGGRAIAAVMHGRVGVASSPVPHPDLDVLRAAALQLAGWSGLVGRLHELMSGLSGCL